MTNEIPYSTWDLEAAESQGTIDQMNAEATKKKKEDENGELWKDK